MKTLFQLLLAGALFAGGCLLGRRSAEVVTTETVRTDTVFYAAPAVARVLPPTFATVRLPRVVFAPGDTIVRVFRDSTLRVPAADSIDVQVAVERREYADSTYRAQVSGPRIGELGPSLDWIETYNTTLTQTRTAVRRSRFAVTAGIGGAYTPGGFQPYAGVGVGVILWSW